MLLYGERERVFRRDEAWLLARLQQGSRRTIPDAGHLAGFDQPTRVADAVLAFALARMAGAGWPVDVDA